MPQMTITIQLDTTAQVDAIASALEMSLEMSRDQRKSAGFSSTSSGRTRYNESWTAQDEDRFLAGRQAYEALTGRAFQLS